MRSYDATFKLMLRAHARQLERTLAGDGSRVWIESELPRAQTTRADLLGKSANGDLLHIEIQATNDPRIGLRMAEYALGILRQHGRMPRQVLFYVGFAPLRMPAEWRGHDYWFRVRVVDARELEVEPFLQSPDLDDNLVALLGRLRQDEARKVIRRLLRRIAEAAPVEKEDAYQRLLLLAGLRRLESIVEEEKQAMPFEIDLSENKILGPPYMRGVAEGEKRGEARGEARGELRLLKRLISQRFGPLPAWAEERLQAKTGPEIEVLADRLLNAEGLSDLLDSDLDR